MVHKLSCDLHLDKSHLPLGGQWVEIDFVFIRPSDNKRGKFCFYFNFLKNKQVIHSIKFMFRPTPTIRRARNRRLNNRLNAPERVY